MLMAILFDVIVVCFALALICWSASELLHIWQAGVIMSLIFLVGTLALFVRLVVVCVSGNVLVDDNIWTIFTFTFAVMALYLHFRLFGTMIMPAASVLLVVVEMLQHVGFWPQLGFAFDISGEPWLGQRRCAVDGRPRHHARLCTPRCEHPQPSRTPG